MGVLLEVDMVFFVLFVNVYEGSGWISFVFEKK